MLTKLQTIPRIRRAALTLGATLFFHALAAESLHADRIVTIDGRVLEFRTRGAEVVDAATGSEWNLFGEAVAGPLKGKALAPVESGVHFAFAWLAFNPASEIAAELR